MSNYISTKIHLSEGQINKLKSAYKKGEEVTLQIDKNKSPNYDILLTKTQINQIKNGKRITISKSELKKFGGFLPFLLPLLTSLALGTASGAAGWGTKKILDKISGSGCEKKKKTSWKGSLSKLGISNEVIEKNMKKERGFRGVFTVDLLPKKMKNFENGIINLDISTGSGTHWVCYYNDKNNNFVEYFDPFGEYEYKGMKLKNEIIPEKIVKYLKTSRKEIRYNSSFLQQPESVKCGYYCMKYITERNTGKSASEVLYSFTQEPSRFNEIFVLNK